MWYPYWEQCALKSRLSRLTCSQEQTTTRLLCCAGIRLLCRKFTQLVNIVRKTTRGVLSSKKTTSGVLSRSFKSRVCCLMHITAGCLIADLVLYLTITVNLWITCESFICNYLDLICRYFGIISTCRYSGIISTYPKHGNNPVRKFPTRQKRTRKAENFHPGKIRPLYISTL